MINFRDAFKKGIEAAQIAENNTKEIYSVFNELNNQLKQETNNSLKITIKEYYVTTGLQGLNDFLNFRQRETYLAIVAFNPLLNGGEEKGVQIAKWRIDKNGYPCRILLDNTELICEDKEALETNISFLLCDPTVGAKLFKITNLELPKVIELEERKNEKLITDNSNENVIELVIDNIPVENVIELVNDNIPVENNK